MGILLDEPNDNNQANEGDIDVANSVCERRPSGERNSLPGNTSRGSLSSAKCVSLTDTEFDGEEARPLSKTGKGRVKKRSQKIKKKVKSSTPLDKKNVESLRSNDPIQ